MNEAHRLFVYGTLITGERNHHLLEHAVQLEKTCYTSGRLVDTGNGYPALVENSPETTIGELYEIDDDLLHEINYLEGYRGEGENNLYERRVQPISAGERHYDAFVYVFESDRGLPMIPENDWKEYRQRSSQL